MRCGCQKLEKNNPCEEFNGISWNKPTWQDCQTRLHCAETIFGRFFDLLNKGACVHGFVCTFHELNISSCQNLEIWSLVLGEINVAKLEPVSRNWNLFQNLALGGRIPAELLNGFIFATLLFDQLLLFYFLTFVAVIIAKSYCFFGKAPGLQGPYCTLLSFRGRKKWVTKFGLRRRLIKISRWLDIY